jgi:hypothetical protein
MIPSRTIVGSLGLAGSCLWIVSLSSIEDAAGSQLLSTGNSINRRRRFCLYLYRYSLPLTLSLGYTCCILIPIRHTYTYTYTPQLYIYNACSVLRGSFGAVVPA